MRTLGSRIGLFTIVLALAGCGIGRRPAAGPTSPSSTPATPSFAARLDDRSPVQIATEADCAQLADKWMHALCDKIELFSPSRMPQTSDELQTLARTGDMEQTMDAAYAWFMLRGDSSFCSYESVQVWVSMGMKTKDGKQACLDSMANVWQRGTMGITNGQGGPNLEISLDVPFGPQPSMP